MRKGLGILFAMIAIGTGIMLATVQAVSARDDEVTEEQELMTEFPELSWSGQAGDEMPDLTARAAILIEAKTGRVLYARNAESRMFPASTTKMMTLILALEQNCLDDVVTVSDEAEGTEGSTLWLEKGETIPMEGLLYGMMMVSGNDATIAIAEHLAGDVPSFARQMTERAHELGAKDTNFVNPNGLPDEKHYTTAHDLARIAAHGYTLPGFEEIVSCKEETFPWVHDPSHYLRNENRILWLVDGGNGVKTGYTDAAGRCLVSAARRDGIQLIAVVLDSTYMWNDSIALLERGFKKVQPHWAIRAGQADQKVLVEAGRQKFTRAEAAEDLVVPGFEGGEVPDYELSYDLVPVLNAPVKRGDPVGTLRVMLEGKEIASTPLLAADDVEIKSFFLLMWKEWQGFWRNLSGEG